MDILRERMFSTPYANAVQVDSVTYAFRQGLRSKTLFFLFVNKRVNVKAMLLFTSHYPPSPFLPTYTCI